VHRILSKSTATSGQAEVGGLIGRPGLEAVERQLEDVIVVLRAERQRRMAGSVIRRPAWKNLVFAGTAGSGKSRAAAAVGRVYRELGLLSSGRLNEVAAMDLAGATRAETGALMGAAATRSTGCVLMIKDADAWHGLPDSGQHVLWELYKKLTEYRDELRDELAVILAGDGVSSTVLRWERFITPSRNHAALTASMQCEPMTGITPESCGRTSRST
jgi:hypothetical protein